MSRINGDKSRSAIAHKRGVHRRAKIRQLLEAKKSQSSGKGAAPSGERQPPRARS